MKARSLAPFLGLLNCEEVLSGGALGLMEWEAHQAHEAHASHEAHAAHEAHTAHVAHASHAAFSDS